MLVARPVAVFLCLAPFRFRWREKLFIAWVGLRGAVGIFLASIPLLVGLPNAQIYFDIAFVVVLISLLIQGWTIARGRAPAARRVAAQRSAAAPRRARSAGAARAGDRRLSGRRQQPLSAARPHAVLGEADAGGARQNDPQPEEAGAVREGDYVYLLAPPEKAQALDRFFVDMPPPAAPDPRLLGDFFVSGDVTLGALARNLRAAGCAQKSATSLADFFADQASAPAVRQGDILPLGAIALVAHTVTNGRVTSAACGSPSRNRFDANADDTRRGAPERAVLRAAACGARYGYGGLASQSGRRAIGTRPSPVSMIAASTPNTAAIRCGVNTSRGRRRPPAGRDPSPRRGRRSARRA